MGRSRKSAEFRKRSDAARRGWKTRRRLADGGFRLEIPKGFRDPFRKYLEAPDPRAVRRMVALVGYERPSTGYRDSKVPVYMILKVGLGPMTGAAAAKLRLEDIKRDIKDMGLKGKIVRVLGIAAIEPASARRGKRVFPKSSKKKKRGRHAR